MTVDLEILTIAELDNLIANHKRLNATDKPIFLRALAELEGRKASGLKFDKSYAIIKDAAERGRFLSYKELADASGAEWSHVHYSLGGHLWRFIDYAHRNGWPMLSAIVVNKPNIETGAMEPATLAGFIAAARDLGHDVDDPEAFLKEQQALVFAWAQRGSTA